MVVARDESGNWVLTAFDKDTPAKEKKKGKTLPPEAPLVSQTRKHVLSLPIFPKAKIMLCRAINKGRYQRA